MEKVRLRYLSVILILSFVLQPLQLFGQDKPNEPNVPSKVLLPMVNYTAVEAPAPAPLPAPSSMILSRCPDARVVTEIVCDESHVCEVVRSCDTPLTGGPMFLGSMQGSGNPAADVIALITAYLGVSATTFWISNNQDAFALRISSVSLGKDYVSSNYGAGHQSYTYSGALNVERIQDTYEDAWHEAEPDIDFGDYRQYSLASCLCWVYDAADVTSRPNGLISLYQIVTGDTTKPTMIRSYVVTNAQIPGKTSVYSGYQPDSFIAELTIDIPERLEGVPPPPAQAGHSGDAVKQAKREASWITLFNYSVTNFDPQNPCDGWDWIGYRLWPSGDKTWFFIKYGLQIFGSDGKVRDGLGLVLNNVSPTALDQLKPSHNPIDPMRPRGNGWWTDTDAGGGHITWHNAKDDNNCPDPTGLVPAQLISVNN